jgi:hypothetical protein
MPSFPRARLRQSRRNSTSGVVTHESTVHDCATEATVHNCNLEATAYDCATKTKVTHRCLFLPTILFQICLNYFFAQKIRYISPLASLRHGIAPPRHRFSIYAHIAASEATAPSQWQRMTELNPHPRNRGYGIRLRHGGSGTQLQPRGYGIRLRHGGQGHPLMPFFVHYFYFKFVNTYAKIPPLASFHTGCDHNRSVESLAACHRIGYMTEGCALDRKFHDCGHEMTWKGGSTPHPVPTLCTIRARKIIAEV